MSFKNVFQTELPVNIYDINYGGHLAHDRLISLMHEARIRFFESIGQSEISFYGVGLILKSVHVDYKKEVFHGEVLHFILSITDIKGAGFSVSYKVTNQAAEMVAEASLEIVTFDYNKRKVARLSHEFSEKLALLS